VSMPVVTRHEQLPSTTTTPHPTLLDRLALRFGVALVEWAGHAQAREVARTQRRRAREEQLRERARLQAELDREQLRLDSIRLFHSQIALYRNLQ